MQRRVGGQPATRGAGMAGEARRAGRGGTALARSTAGVPCLQGPLAVAPVGLQHVEAGEDSLRQHRAGVPRGLQAQQPVKHGQQDRRRQHYGRAARRHQLLGAAGLVGALQANVHLGVADFDGRRGFKEAEVGAVQQLSHPHAPAHRRQEGLLGDARAGAS